MAQKPNCLLKGKSLNVFVGTALAVFFLSHGPAYADPAAMEKMQRQMEMLSKQVEKLSAVVEQQGRLIEAQKAQLDAQTATLQNQGQKVAQQQDKIEALKLSAIAPAAGEEKKEDKDAVKISMKGPGPLIESADGKFSFQPFGRVHIDTTFFSDDKSDQPDNAHLRRARLGFKGNLGEDFNYKAEVDFGGEAVNLKEVFLAYTGFELATLQIGNFKPPFGMELNTSTNFTPFIENAPVTNAFARDEILGVAWKGGGDNWAWGLGAFNEDPGSNNGADESWSVDARASLDLLQESPHVLHAGLGGSYRHPNQLANAMTFAGRPGGTGTNLVTTGALTVNDALIWGPEAAAVFGPFWAQGEYMRADVDRLGAPADNDFDGWYAQAGIFLTGETRPYNGKTGNFDRLKPKHPFSLKKGEFGAWELTARYDELDLNDTGAGVAGGEMKNMTFGVNWYINNYIRTMFNVTRVNTDQNAVTPDDDPHLYIFRTAFDY